MTNVITRLYQDTETAEHAESRLRMEGLPRNSAYVISAEGEDAKSLEHRMLRVNVHEDAASAYASKVAAGKTLLVVRTTYKPLGAAQIARDVLSDFDAIDVGPVTDDYFFPDGVETASSVLKDHPLIMTPEPFPVNSNHYMAHWPFPLIIRRNPSTYSIFPRHARMADFPIPLLDDRKPFTDSIIPRHARMANFPIRLISRRVPKNRSIFPRHARMANFPIPLISRRVPKNRSIFPRHARMASYPVPLLMNWGTGKNYLMPAGTRMANFPIGLISRRVPKNRSIFPRHARMANFPIRLISRRVPKNRSIFPRHARMADKFLPLVIKHGNDKAEGGAKAFSLSKMLGLPTLSR